MKVEPCWQRGGGLGQAPERPCRAPRWKSWTTACSQKHARGFLWKAAGCDGPSLGCAPPGRAARASSPAARADRQHRRAASSAFAFSDRADDEAVSPEDRASAIRLGAGCVLAFSRVARESLGKARTLGELRAYLSDLQAREDMLNGVAVALAPCQLG
ncbi:unnamed protein product [Prorocentrum cordatum]|uniref:Uncharacterized protein n=1 Tax=Prorocentrum cordatum TaxID=2364126 RepID=A0ABN9UR01_9DINO|nr:unnamed protein product [Polarella glacialis]